MAPRWPTGGLKMHPGALQVTFVRLVYSWRIVVGWQSMSQIENVTFYTGFIVLFELQTQRLSSNVQIDDFTLVL